jgi:hypothetical protein
MRPSSHADFAICRQKGAGQKASRPRSGRLQLQRARTNRTSTGVMRVMMAGMVMMVVMVMTRESRHRGYQHRKKKQRQQLSHSRIIAANYH